MWRGLLIAGLLAFVASAAHAAPIGPWQVCRGPAPAVTDCRPLQGVLDPQGRELWLRAPVGARGAEDRAPTLYVFGAASTEAWFNGVRVGANGKPGPTADQEQPGLYQGEIPL